MALDPRISLAVQAPSIDIGQAFRAPIQGAGMLQKLQQLEQQTQAGQVAAEQEQLKMSDQERNRQILSVATGAQGLLAELGSDINIGAGLKFLNRRLEDLSASETPDTRKLQDTKEAIAILEGGDAKQIQWLMGKANDVIEIAESQRLLDTSGDRLTAGEQEFESLIAGFTDEEKAIARKVKAGIAPRAGTSAQERIAEDETKTEQVAKSQAQIAGAKAAATEVAKLSKQLELKPEVEAAVVEAVGQAKADIKLAGDKRSNETAFNVYQTATDNLVKSLGGTTTGPGAGFLPAITANAQIANGAVAMMAPVLKQLFRGSGEGTFTDQDQKMLLALVPTRDTLPEARTAQLAAIDSLVRAKLGMAVDSPPKAGADEVSTLSDDDLFK